MYPLVGRLDRNRRTLGLVRISTHAPLAGCDTRRFPSGTTICPISIHAPLAGCDISSLLLSSAYPLFQSTHPLRGATHPDDSDAREAAFQSTHPLRGATLAPVYTGRTSRFQSTHPLRGATCCFGRRVRRCEISIHAPLAGCDPWLSAMRALTPNFNPRTPCGVRRRSL